MVVWWGGGSPDVTSDWPMVSKEGPDPCALQMPPFYLNGLLSPTRGGRGDRRSSGSEASLTPDRETSEGEGEKKKEKEIYKCVEDQKKGEDKWRCWHHVGIRDGTPAVTGCSGSGSR